MGTYFGELNEFWELYVTWVIFYYTFLSLYTGSFKMIFIICGKMSYLLGFFLSFANFPCEKHSSLNISKSIFLKDADWQRSDIIIHMAFIIELKQIKLELLSTYCVQNNIPMPCESKWLCEWEEILHNVPQSHRLYTKLLWITFPKQMKTRDGEHRISQV